MSAEDGLLEDEVAGLELVRRILAIPEFGHRIKGDPDEGEWECTCHAASDYETAEEHIGLAVFRGAFPFLRPTEDGLRAAEIAFTNAVNARSALGNGLAVPHHRDVEAIWRAITPFLARTVR